MLRLVGSVNDDELVNSFSLLANSDPNDNVSESEPNATVDKISVACHIDTLPNELLEHIFLESCEIGTEKPLEALDIITFPWVSGQVCRRWRNFALGFPQMWTNFRVHIEQINTFATVIWHDISLPSVLLSEDSLAIIQEHLLRCRGFPLTFHLEFITDGSEVQPIILVKKMFSIIGAHFEQWETATFNIESTTLAQSLFNQVSTCPPS
ncbi:hypothetical protein C8J56DRAFT_1087810 [Mycena floridula]|nr:hypothetical protein C8J56DRAFT_1087810 [Mycena floridula]